MHKIAYEFKDGRWIVATVKDVSPEFATRVIKVERKARNRKRLLVLSSGSGLWTPIPPRIAVDRYLRDLDPAIKIQRAQEMQQCPR